MKVMAKNVHSSYNPESIILNNYSSILTVNNKMSWKEKMSLNMLLLRFAYDEISEKNT